MSPTSIRLLTGAALAGTSLLLAACGGGNEDVIRQQGELRGKLEAQAGEVEALRTRVRDLESRSRSLEEQVAAVSAGIPSGPRAGATAAVPDAGPGAEPGAADPSGEDLAALLETQEGKDKLREFLQEEETRKSEADRLQRREQMETLIRDRVTGYMTEQLGLSTDQQARVIDIATETMEKMTELWRGARGGAGGPATDFQALREKSEEIRKESMDQLAQALTVTQFEKLQELGPGAGMMMGGRGGFGGPGGGGRGGPPGGGGGGR